ncbi:hypothetical protein HA402_008854 [Bradysia odoriphaga]|nr:hypothetical protein HA402_008854 [Bradysia odoriphaga]
MKRWWVLGLWTKSMVFTHRRRTSVIWRRSICYDIESECDLRSYEVLRLSRDAAEYEAEEYFGKYMFNEELAFVEQGIRERNAH